MNQSGGLWTHRGYFRSVSLYCVVVPVVPVQVEVLAPLMGRFLAQIECLEYKGQINKVNTAQLFRMIVSTQQRLQQFQKHMLKMHQVRLCQMIKMMFEHTTIFPLNTEGDRSQFFLNYARYYCLGGTENLESLLADQAQRDGVLNFYHGITFGPPVLPT